MANISKQAGNVIEIINLTKLFSDGTLAVDNLNLILPRGRIYGMLGPNGSGKTTIIHLIMGILTPTGGAISVLGISPNSNQRSRLRKRIGFMPQELALYEDLTPLEHCVFFGRLNGMKKEEARIAGLELLEFFGLGGKLNSLVHTLSGGLKRRTSLAVSLVHRPELIILDEPTVGVDPALRRGFWKYFRELNTNNVTFLVTTHVFDEVERMDHLLLLHQGKLIEQGPPAELRQRHNVASIEQIFLNMADSEKASMTEGRQ